MDDEENNTLDTGSFGIRQSSSEPQQQQQEKQQSLPSPIQIHKDRPSLQAESLTNEKENKKISEFSHFTVGRIVYAKFYFLIFVSFLDLLDIMFADIFKRSF